jgi:hypothetical protein
MDDEEDFADEAPDRDATMVMPPIRLPEQGHPSEPGHPPAPGQPPAPGDQAR